MDCTRFIAETRPILRINLKEKYMVQDVIDCLPYLGAKERSLKQIVQHKLIEHKLYLDKHGQDLHEILN